MPDPTVQSPAFLTHKTVHSAVVRGIDVPVEDMIRFLDAAFSALRAASDAAAIAVDGSGFTVYHTELEGNIRVDAGYPLIAQLDGPIEFNGVTIEPGELEGGDLARAVFIGPYSELRGAWLEFLEGLEAQGKTPAMPYVEVYRALPSPVADPSALRTDLFAYV